MKFLIIQKLAMKRVVLVIHFLLIVVISTGQIKVACIGNSITSAGYPKILNEVLGSGWEVKNFGVMGTTMLRNGDDPYYKSTTYNEAKDFNPDVVVIKLGTNDSKPQNWTYKGQFVG